MAQWAAKKDAWMSINHNAEFTELAGGDDMYKSLTVIILCLQVTIMLDMRKNKYGTVFKIEYQRIPLLKQITEIDLQ